MDYAGNSVLSYATHAYTDDYCFHKNPYGREFTDWIKSVIDYMAEPLELSKVRELRQI